MEFEVRIPGNINTHCNLIDEMIENLYKWGEYNRFIPIGLKPVIKEVSSANGVGWKIYFQLDERQPYDYFRVVRMARRDCIASIQIVSCEIDGFVLVKFRDGFDLSREKPVKPIGPLFVRLAQRFAFFLYQRKLGEFVEDDNDSKQKGGVNTKTEGRAKVFKQLKDAHPDWNQDKVAMEAIEKLGEYVTGNTVRMHTEL